MDRLPCELLYHIFWYVDQPLDLFRMSCVCNRWRSFIMNDEYFLNQWLSRSLKHSRQPFSSAYCRSNNDCKRKSMLNIDQSLFPINLRSSQCSLLPWPFSRHSSHYENLVHYYPLSFFVSSHSFSFWLFLPHQRKLNLQIRIYMVKSLITLLYDDEKYDLNKGKRMLIADRWIHIVLTKMDSQSNYRIWIDGEYLSKFSQYQTFFSKMERSSSLIHIVLLHNFKKNSLEASSKVRIADLNALKRCLHLSKFELFIKSKHQSTK